MATRRKKIRRPVPRGLAEVSGLELIHWRVYGPNVGGDVHGWPSWEAWAEVYAGCREEMLARDAARRAAQAKHPALARLLEKGPLQVPACERIWQAMARGEDPEQEQQIILDELRANDPRRLLAK